MEENKQLTVGQRIDIFEITKGDYYSPGTVKAGLHRPAKSVYSYGAMLYYEGVLNNELYFQHTGSTNTKDVDCKKVGTMIIKSLK